MKYMGWSYAQLLSCPTTYIDGIIRHAEREEEEYEEARAGHGS